MARPLTKCKKDGVLYTRPDTVEVEIDGALQLDLPALRRRLLVTDRSSPKYLCSECLVHLIRDALRRSDDQRRDAVLEILFGRCEAILKAKISERLPNAEILREEALSELAELLASDGTGKRPNELDVYECRFNLAFRALRIDVIRRELGHVNRKAEPQDHGNEGEPDAYEDVFARVAEAFRTPATQQDGLFLEDLWEAINALPDDEREAVILCHVLGYEKPEAAKRCKCTRRTIDNRLARVAAKLLRFKEDV